MYTVTQGSRPSFEDHLAGTVVAALDERARSVSGTAWSESQHVYEATLKRALPLLGSNRRGWRAMVQADPRMAYGKIRGRVIELMSDDASPSYRSWANNELPTPRLQYHVTTVDDITEIGPHAMTARAGRGDQANIAVIIPFQCLEENSERVENLRSCLQMLERQRLHTKLHIVVVETGRVATHRLWIENRTSEYIHIPTAGPFNKSLAVNRGVASLPDGVDLLCILDADIVLDAHYISRVSALFQQSQAQAMLPYTDMLFMDTETSTAIRSDISRGRYAAGRLLSGYVVLHPPGGVLWTTHDALSSIGGFNESFIGWGGEDTDVVRRLSDAFGIHRTPELLLHMHHERPFMEENRSVIMARAGLALGDNHAID